MADEQEAYFEIGDTKYPMPQAFRLGDPVIVTQLTGLTWGQFVEALDDPDRSEDPVMLLGLISVSVWQGNPRWTRERCARYVEQLDIGSIAVHGPDVEDEPVPPAEPDVAPAEPSVTSPETPNESQVSPSDSTPVFSGLPGSGIGSDSPPET